MKKRRQNRNLHLELRKINKVRIFSHPCLAPMDTNLFDPWPLTLTPKVIWKNGAKIETYTWRPGKSIKFEFFLTPAWRPSIPTYLGASAVSHRVRQGASSSNKWYRMQYCIHVDISNSTQPNCTKITENINQLVSNHSCKFETNQTSESVESTSTWVSLGSSQLAQNSNSLFGLYARYPHYLKLKLAI